MIPSLAFVCSHGRTATHWIAAALNSHPEVFAAHGPISPPTEANGSGRHEQSMAAAWQTQGAFFGLTIEAMIEEMADASPRPFRARVHAINAHQLMEKAKRERPRSPISVVNVIRHPITRIQSFQRQWGHDWRFSRDLQDFMMGYYATNAVTQELVASLARHGLKEPEALDEKLFVCAVAWIGNDFPDLALDVPVFLHERLVADSEYWIEFLQTTFGPLLEIPFTHLKNVERLQPLNARSADARSSLEVYAHWTDWQRFVYRHFALSRSIAAIYRPFGYRFP